LLIDEVLAVGDVAFQKKCLGRMDQVASEGRTVLFVSHNMGAVRSLCKKGIYLEQGRVEEQGSVSACVTRYLRSVCDDPAPDAQSQAARHAGFDRVALDSSDGNTVHQSEDFVASTAVRLPTESRGFELMCLLFDMHGRVIFRTRTTSGELGVADLSVRSHLVSVHVPPLWLVPGLYSLQFKLIPWGRGHQVYKSDKFPLDVEGVVCSTSSADYGLLSPKVEWRRQAAEQVALAGKANGRA
jgi:lipopolysaccharide transport system ATP-binding protein